MAGYLDQYGEGHEQRSKRARYLYIGLGVAALLILFGLDLVPRPLNPLFAVYSRILTLKHKAAVQQFVSLVQKNDYPAAYAMWGCADAKPCRDYPYAKFLEDWGPKSSTPQIASFDIQRRQICGTGVIVTVDINGNRQVRFWLEGNEMTIGYSPWTVCPDR